jgi:NAD(P)-dependent dehydrogenase (short-subunit alcohol dehydrogenase family)
MNSTDIVLITGCGSGIGKALARAFHQAGHRVCATARRPETMADLQGEGLLTLPLDVTSADAIADIMRELGRQGHEVATLVNNAGYGAMGPLMDVPASEWQRQFDVNVFAPMALTRAVLPSMVARRRGRIVNISSVSGVLTTPFAGPYCASKAAVNAMSDALRMELKPLGIEVITVQPGGIRSAFGDNAANQVSLNQGSPYEAIREGVMARANESQARAMPAEQFAATLVSQIMRPGCPPVLRLGEKSRLMPFLKTWLPVRTLDSILSRRFKLHQL